MSCDNELANEWARCSGKSAIYITIPNVIVSSYTVACFIFQFCKQYDLEFLTWRCWIGFWVMIILFGVVALEGCFLIKYFTRFTEDIFELLISAIFIYEPIAVLIKVKALS